MGNKVVPAYSTLTLAHLEENEIRRRKYIIEADFI